MIVWPWNPLVDKGSLPAHAPPWSLYTPRQRWGFLSILFLVCASNYFDYSVLSVLLDPIKREFHVSDTMLGLLSGFCFSLVYAVAGLPIARWADRGNRRTVITVALASWSAATALCGITQSFWQLALARFGLGIAEPGALPPAQSLIADYFPPGQRATAIAFLSQGGSAVGWLAGVALGGYLAAMYGWRTVFVLAGAVGLALALLVRLCLSEPRNQLGFEHASDGKESIGRAFTRLREKRAFVFLLLGVSAYAIFSYGVTIFLPSFMMRSLNASLAQASVTWGIAIASANLMGALTGGWVGDRLSRRDVRWYAWLPAIACVLALPMYGFALRAHDLSSFVARDFVAELFLSIGLPSTFAAVHVVCGNRRRAVAIATLMLSLTLFGSGFGPLIVGWLSDVLSSAYGTESLRHSLTTMLVFLIPAAVAFYCAARAMPQDVED
jgi:MFS family permease